MTQRDANCRRRRRVGVRAGLRGVADEIDENALEGLARQTSRGREGCRRVDRNGDGRPRQSAEQRRKIAKDLGEIAAGAVVALQQGRGRGRLSEQAVDQAGAAVGEGAELGEVMPMLRPEDAGAVEQIAVKAEAREEIAGVVGKACAFGERCGAVVRAGRAGRANGMEGPGSSRQGGCLCGRRTLRVSLHDDALSNRLEREVLHSEPSRQHGRPEQYLFGTAIL